MTYMFENKSKYKIIKKSKMRVINLISYILVSFPFTALWFNVTSAHPGHHVICRYSSVKYLSEEGLWGLQNAREA